MFWLHGTPAIAVDPSAVQRYERERMTAVSSAVRRVDNIVSRCAMITHECCDYADADAVSAWCLSYSVNACGFVQTRVCPNSGLHTYAMIQLEITRSTITASLVQRWECERMNEYFSILICSYLCKLFNKLIDAHLIQTCTYNAFSFLIYVDYVGLERYAEIFPA